MINFMDLIWNYLFTVELDLFLICNLHLMFYTSTISVKVFKYNHFIIILLL